MPEDKGIKITTTDLETGESQSTVIHDDVVVTTAGRHYVAGVQKYPGTGTQVWTIKVGELEQVDDDGVLDDLANDYRGMPADGDQR